MKTTSRFAIAAAAGVIAGSLALSPAQAADFGGDCCADLEERIAELEATTVRKGTRVVSLTINGWVHKGVIFWDDGIERNAYVVDMTNASSRVRFSGSARIDPDWSAGFVYEWEFDSARTVNVNQIWSGPGSGTQGTDRYNTRHAYWWLRSDRLGQISVGQQSSASDGAGSTNLGGGPNNGNNVHHFNQGFQVASSKTLLDGTRYSGLTWRNFYSQFGGGNLQGDRGNFVRYDSPALHGFIFSAAWGEDDVWDVALRYAQEWNSIRVAAAVGYMESKDAFNGCPNHTILLTTPTWHKPGTASDCELWVASASIRHTPSGLYVAGGYAESRDKLRSHALHAALFAPSGSLSIDRTDDNWWIQVGLSRRLLSQPWWGNTTIWVGYTETNRGDFINATFNARHGLMPGSLISTSSEMWEFGVNQDITAAAMNVYVFYRNHSPSVSVRECVVFLCADGRLDHLGSHGLEDFDVVGIAGRVRF